MIGLSINENTRAAALDGALSFSVLLQNQRELTLGSAQSSVTGLLSAIRSAPTDYASLLQTAQDAFQAHIDSGNKLTQPAWTDTPAATRDAIDAAVSQALSDQLATAQATANAALAQADAARNGTTSPSEERTLATSIDDAAATILNALAGISSNQDAQAALALASARSQAANALQQAQTLLTTLLAQNPQPAARIASVQATISAAQSVISVADSAGQLASGALAAAAGSTPVSQQLSTDTPPATFLTTWGDSGIVSLTDASGQGILISPDGKVDTIPPSGNGWQFQNDSTFLLPDGTKVSVSPGTPASILATRGQQRIEISNLQSGQSPTTQRFTSGGLAADAARNDGYVFVMGADPRQWTLSGAALGDEANREVVGTTPLQNEQTVDVTNVTLSPDLLAALQSLGVDPAAFDENHDGRFNTRELQTLVAALESTIQVVQGRYQGALSNTSTAIESLLQLNEFLEKIIAESDRRQENRQKVSAEERDQLQQIQSDLTQARSGLRAPAPSATAPQPNSGAEVLATARLVLNQVGALAPGSGPGAESRKPATESPTNLSASAPSTEPGSAPSGLSQALRRAERLLSGLAGGPGIFRLSDTPLAQPGTVGTAPSSGEPLPQPGPTPQSVDSGAAAFASAPTPGAPSVPAPLPGPFANESTPPPSILPDGTSPAVFSAPLQPVLTGIDVSTQPVVPASEKTPVLSASQTRPSEPSPSHTAPEPLVVGSSLQNPGSVPGSSDNLPPTPLPLVPSGPNPLPNLTPASTAFAPLAALPTQFFPSGSSASSRTTPVSADSAPSQIEPSLPGRLHSAPPELTVNIAPPATGSPEAVSPREAFSRELGRRIGQHLSTYREQIATARQLQNQVRAVVEQFLVIVGKDEQLRQVFNADDLSDDQRANFRGKVESLERELGLTWGGDPAKSPQTDANLNARVITSGMMI
ncbi:hypothetical protein DB347_06235 [Opitutaceae bacterium EW11]|nr:hypothetical protein DB347_06235 [Opitutaceae bacterium EW11]